MAHFPNNSLFRIGRDATPVIVIEQNEAVITYSKYSHDEKKLVELTTRQDDFKNQVTVGGKECVRQLEALTASNYSEEELAPRKAYIEFARQCFVDKGLDHPLAGIHYPSSLEQHAYVFTVDHSQVGSENQPRDAYAIAKYIGMENCAANWNYGVVVTNAMTIANYKDDITIIDKLPAGASIEELDNPRYHLLGTATNPQYDVEEQSMGDFDTLKISTADEELSVALLSSQTGEMLDVGEMSFDQAYQLTSNMLRKLDSPLSLDFKSFRDIALVVVPETASWNLDVLNQNHVAQAYGVYLIDYASAYHPADVRPHVDAMLVKNHMVLTQEGFNKLDSLGDALSELEMENSGSYQCMLLSDVQKLTQINLTDDIPLDDLFDNSIDNLFQRLDEKIQANWGNYPEKLSLKTYEPSQSVGQSIEEDKIQPAVKPKVRLIAGQITEIDETGFTVKSPMAKEPIEIPMENSGYQVGDKVKIKLTIAGDQIDVDVKKIGLEL